MDKTLYTLIVHSENIAGLLNQITAVFTRRQINIESLNVSASSIKGCINILLLSWTTQDVIEKVVKQIEKKIDVLQAHYFTDSEFISMRLLCTRFLLLNFRRILWHLKLSAVIMPAL